MDLIITILPVVTKDLPISPRFTPFIFLSRCEFSTLTARQPMVDARRILEEAEYGLEIPQTRGSTNPRIRGKLDDNRGIPRTVQRN